MFTYSKWLILKENTQDKVLWLIVSIDAFRFIFINTSESILVLIQGIGYEVSTLVAPLNFVHQFPIHH